MGMGINRCVAVKLISNIFNFAQENWLKRSGSFSRGIAVGIGEDLFLDSSLLVMPKSCLHVVLSEIFVLKRWSWLHEQEMLLAFWLHHRFVCAL